MRRNVWAASAVAIAAGCVVGLSAQSGTETSRAQSGANPATTITINGCLQNAGATGVGTSGSATASTSADSSRTASDAMTGGSYILTNAMTGTSGAGSTAGSGGSATTDRTSGAAGTTGSESSSSATSVRGNTYILEGRETELKNHVGHRIEVTGTTDSSSRPASADSSASTTSGSTSASASASNSGQRFRVNSIRMISADCSSSAK